MDHFRRDSRFYMPQQGDQFQYNNPSLSSPTAAPFSWRNPDNSAMEKEHMFDKVVTPSDVGKLNRLVIPKQHAEKYFPLNSAANEKGLLLSFEDRTGKSWRFRYSYWNSSQSYVMTKGWSRFVKEKRLDAGDTVSFGRGVGDAAARDRLFIDWQSRPAMIRIDGYHPSGSFQLPRPNYPLISRSIIDPWRNGGASGIVGSPLFSPSGNPMAIPCNNYHSHSFNATNLSSGSNINRQQLLYFRAPALARDTAPLVLDSVPVAKNQAAAKRVRLFGVNLDCSESAEMGRDLQLQPAMSVTTLQLMEIPGTSTPSSPTNKGRSLSFDLEL